MSKLTVLSSKIVLAAVVVALAAGISSSPAQAKVLPKPKVVAPAVTVFTYSVPNLCVSEPASVNNVNFQLTYNHFINRTKTITDQMGGRFVRTRTRTRKCYFVGTQSSNAFIAHRVKDGTLDYTVNLANGDSYQGSRSFTVKRGVWSISATR